MSEEKETSKIIYNRNPFVPKGRLNRKHFFIFMMLLNVMSKIAEYDLSKAESISAIINALIAILLTLFVVKNRIYDITLSNKKAWVLGVLYCGIIIVLQCINPQLVYLMLPFGLLLLFVSSKGASNER